MSEKYGCYKSQSEQYEIFICNSENIERYYIVFQDVNGSFHEVEITEAVYFEFLKSFRVMDNHRWRSWYHGTVELHENMIPAAPVPSLEDTITERELLEKIGKLIASLPTKQRRRFILYYEFGLNYSEIARQEGCTVRAIKNTIIKVKEKINLTLSQE